ncbi:MAG: ankyrin repeat domain-containing protein [Pseudomonadales bacterium]|nr:ankyrin repeat domain-containing protein [Pseudomonadales bacterium]
MNRIISALCLSLSLGLVLPAMAATPLIDAIRQRDSAQALALIEQGAPVNATETNGTSALHWAVYHNDLPVVERLLRAEAKVSAVNDYDATPMSEAAFYGDIDMVGTLLEAGADADSANAYGQTALMVVARTDKVDLARLLLDHGADVNARESRGGQSALMWAAAKGRPAMLALLIERGAELDAQSTSHDRDRRVTSEPRVKYQASGGLTALMFAAREGCFDCIVKLTEAGADLDISDPDGGTALNLAIQNGRFDIARYLIEQGADVNLWDWWGRGPLYSAVDMNTLPTGGRADLPSVDQTTALDIVALLLEKGANPNLQLKFLVPFRNVGSDRGGDLVLSTGATPLLRAAKAGDLAVVRLLLAHGANTELHTYGNWVDWAGGTRPLAAAAGLSYQLNDTRGQGNTQELAIATIDLLLAAGADIDAQDTHGRTAVHGAVFRGWDKVLTHLAERGADLRLADFAGLTPLAAAQGKVEARNRETINISPGTAAVLEKLLAHH